MNAGKSHADHRPTTELIGIKELRKRHYDDACPCSSCCAVRRRRVEPRTGQPTDQGSR